MARPSVYNITDNTIIINGQEMTLQEFIELAKTATHVEMAERFGVSQPTIHRIIRKATGTEKKERLYLRLTEKPKQRKRMPEGARMALLPYEYIERVR